MRASEWRHCRETSDTALSHRTADYRDCFRTQSRSNAVFYQPSPAAREQPHIACVIGSSIDESSAQRHSVNHGIDLVVSVDYPD